MHRSALTLSYGQATRESRCSRCRSANAGAPTADEAAAAAQVSRAVAELTPISASAFSWHGERVDVRSPFGTGPMPTATAEALLESTVGHTLYVGFFQTGGTPACMSTRLGPRIGGLSIRDQLHAAN